MIKMKIAPTKHRFAIGLAAIGAVAALIACLAAAFNARSKKPPLPSPEPPAAPAEVRVKAVEAKSGAGKPVDAAAASAAVATVCGADAETAGRYEARSDALKSIATAGGVHRCLINHI